MTQTIAPLKVVSVPIGSVKQDPANVRKHGERNLEQITASLSRFGQQKPIVVDAKGIIRAGNGTYAAAKALGWKKIAVVRTNLSGPDAIAYAIADNRTAELAEWDVEALGTQWLGLDEELQDVAGFDQAEIDALLKEIEPVAPIVEDEAPDATTVPQRCAAGDLWALGNHRLLCGDSTKAEDVSRLLGDAKPFLMVTDPPYGVEYDPTWRDGKGGFSTAPVKMRGKVVNDDRVDWTETYRLFPGSVAYIWHASLKSVEVGTNVLAAGYEIRATIVWRKQQALFGQGHYHWQHEPCWYAVKKGETAKWAGDRKQSTIWDIQNLNPTGNRTEERVGHGTQKPVECMARPIRNHGGKDDDVYDPFLGSGTTLIAAEQLGRRCFGIEISPKYCDVIIARWEKLTGKEAKKL